MAESLQLLQVQSDGLGKLRCDCTKLSSPHVDNLWLPCAELRASQPQQCCVHAFVAALYRHIEPAVRAIGGGKQCTGAEIWVQQYQSGKGLAFHFDKDEALMREQTSMHHPMCSSVFYLTGDAAEQRQGVNQDGKCMHALQHERCRTGLQLLACSSVQPHIALRTDCHLMTIFMPVKEGNHVCSTNCRAVAAL